MFFIIEYRNWWNPVVEEIVITKKDGTTSGGGGGGGAGATQGDKQVSVLLYRIQKLVDSSGTTKKTNIVSTKKDRSTRGGDDTMEISSYVKYRQYFLSSAFRHLKTSLRWLIY